MAPDLTGAVRIGTNISGITTGLSIPVIAQTRLLGGPNLGDDAKASGLVEGDFLGNQPATPPALGEGANA